MLRELDLVGPGTRVNTTDAEIVYFKHAQHRSVTRCVTPFHTLCQTFILLRHIFYFKN